jgi:enamine deaminase RidA (YjgF/YER057c/UK114 family)
MPQIQYLNPDSLGKPLGQYSQITRVKASEFLFIAGQVGAAKDGTTAATSTRNAPRPSPTSARLCNRRGRALPIS